MEKQLLELSGKISSYVWGDPLIVLLVGTGLFLSVRLGFVQFRYMWYSLKLVFQPEQKNESGEISNFKALMTALAATVGTGNIAGVATAIFKGGPGAVFWMWVTGLLGMATKYSEALLAVHYREIDENGVVSGGPMYYIEKGMKLKWLAVAFAIFTTFASFGIGNMTQSNSVADVLYKSFEIPMWVTGLVLVVLVFLSTIGGIKSIGKVAVVVVPAMIVFYGVFGIYILVANFQNVGSALGLIFSSAFTGEAIGGGILGHTVKEAMRFGLARGIFSNESGLGSSPIAAAAAKTSHPGRQALISMTQTFIDTIIVCTLTAVVILMAFPHPTETGAALTAEAFSELLPGNSGGMVVAISLAVFAFSTILGWSYYGEKAIEYLVGKKLIIYYRLFFIVLVFIGATTKLELVWNFSDITNGLMALPNLIALLALSGVIVKVHRHYIETEVNVGGK